ncbi:16S rRNA (adenine(1518)-N(6)/adenine(1519)-N(6))-dimethyltransferase RsmA [Paratractidigestivibacter faecalis]|uniref:16S rRNA (adenine(1518)-N(6)/adenine(1519)-N(6))- dimethyltransferase RsmA n=1 Tax=Paratractidigestivibacter faecalis TaxID=2292441 RepID=UPI003A953875
MTYSRLANPRETRAVLEDFGLATKHRLGQNFLVNDEVIGRIVNLAELDGNDVVLEVGPGIGTLTVAMLSACRAVCSIEADRELEQVLAQTCATDGEKFALVMGDALRVTPAQVDDALAGLTKGQSLCQPCQPNKFVANLPYQVAATLILKFFQDFGSLKRACVMVQAEVADRICAAPGNKTYGAYTAKLALLARPTGRFEVGPGNFMPPPHVDSAVVRLDRMPMADPVSGEPLSAERAARVAEVIDAAFAQRRKTIRNSMGANGFEKDALDAAFAVCDIAPTARAETLSPEDFVRLEGALS